MPLPVSVSVGVRYLEYVRNVRLKGSSNAFDKFLNEPEIKNETYIPISNLMRFFMDKGGWSKGSLKYELAGALGVILDKPTEATLKDGLAQKLLEVAKDDPNQADAINRVLHKWGKKISIEKLKAAPAVTTPKPPRAATPLAKMAVSGGGLNVDRTRYDDPSAAPTPRDNVVTRQDLLDAISRMGWRPRAKNKNDLQAFIDKSRKSTYPVSELLHFFESKSGGWNPDSFKTQLASAMGISIDNRKPVEIKQDVMDMYSTQPDADGIIMRLRSHDDFKNLSPSRPPSGGAGSGPPSP